MHALLTLVATGLAALMAACDDQGEIKVRPPGGSEEEDVPSTRIISKIVTRNGRSHIQYNGKPYLMYGVQIRLDDFEGGYTSDIMGEHMSKAAEAGFRSVCIPVGWQMVETAQDVYEMTIIDRLISHAATYDLDVHLLWFGVNVCGWANTVPQYIWNDRSSYPRHPDFPDRTFDLSNTRLLDRIDKVAEKLMEHLAANDPKGRISMIQIENESDNADGYDTNWSDPEDVFRKGFSGGQMTGVYEAINRFGNAVHSGKQRMVTRHNFTRMPMLNEKYLEAGVMKKSAEVKGLDIAGMDNYAYTSADQNKVIDFMYGQLPENNVFHIPETNAHISTTVNLLMEAFEQGVGVLLYELRTSPKRGYDLGIYRKTEQGWIERDGTGKVAMLDDGVLMPELKHDEIIRFNKMIYKAAALVASLPVERIAAFNTENAGSAYSNPGKKCGNYTITYSSETGGEAMAMCDMSGNLVFMSLYDGGVFGIKGRTIEGEVSVGHFDSDGGFVEESTVPGGATITLGSSQCAYVKTASIR